MSFGARLRSFREQQGLTLEDLSERTGFSAGFLRDLEEDKLPMPMVEVYQLLAQALELADYFYVTTWIVRRKLIFLRQDLRREQGLRVKGLRDLFAPVLVDAYWAQVVDEERQIGVAS